MMRRHFLLLLLSYGVIAVVLTGLLVGFRTLLRPELEIQLHNTYFVLPPYQLVLTLLLPLLLLALAGTVLWRKSPKMTLMLLVAFSLLLLFSTEHLTQILTQLAVVSAPMFPAEAAPQRWLLLAQVLHLVAIAGVGYGCYQLGRRVVNR